VIKAKKSLGQNFLIDKNIIEKIINTVKIKDKTILEVGPGTGNLTSCILQQKPKKVIVVEKDNNLAVHLKNIFNNQITIINEIYYHQKN
jgi:16S rRNA (adenine1518-N6/adenine1519-N6)-dimethyltransferase